jgi:hypothetical protein
MAKKSTNPKRPGTVTDAPKFSQLSNADARTQAKQMDHGKWVRDSQPSR